ncbi:MAG: hypothetical protein GY754_15600 [bacterium]|nr:hypothetical protein [bacterium]
MQTIAAKRAIEGEGSAARPGGRILLPRSIDPCNEHHKKSVYTKEVDRVHFGKTVIDLTGVELSQTKAIMESLLYINKYIDGTRSLKALFLRHFIRQ